MTGNHAITYQGPMQVTVLDIDYPTFELKDGPEVNPANVGRKVPHGAIRKVVTTNTAAPTSTWFAAAPPRPRCAYFVAQ